MLRRASAWICTVLMMLGVVVAAAAPAGSAPASATNIMAAPQPVSVETVLGFADVTESTTFAREITWLASEGISRGWGSGSAREFRPLVSITREQMAAFLYRMEGSPEVALPAASPFRDVAPGSTFYQEIIWLAEEGITRGWTTSRGTEFRPLEPITREQMAAFLYRMADEPVYAVPVDPRFTDVGVESTFYREIEWLASTEVTTGWVTATGAQYRPLARTNRDVMAAFLYRYTATVEPEVAPVDGVVVAPETTVVDGDDLDGATFEREAGRLVLPASSLLDPNPNDVLTAGVTDATPEGLLVRVIAVETLADGARVLTVEAATLTDAVLDSGGRQEPTPTLVSDAMSPLAEGAVVYPDGWEQAAMARTEAAGESAPLATRRFGWSTAFTAEPGSSVDGILPPQDRLSASLDMSGSVDTGFVTDAEMGLDFAFDADLHGLKELDFAVWDSYRTTHWGELSIEGSASMSYRIVQWTPTWTVMLGPVPVVITAQFIISASVSASGEITLSYDKVTQVDTKKGVTFEDGGFHAIDEKDTPLDDLDLGFDGAATLRTGLAATGDLRLYGVVGMQAAAGPYVSFALTSDWTSPATWGCPFEVGLEGSVSVVAGVSAFGVSVGPQFSFPVVDGTLPLHEADPCAVSEPTLPSGPGVPLAIATPELPDAIEGAGYATQLRASGGLPQYVWRVSGLPAGLSASSGGAITGSPTEFGEFAVSVWLFDGQARASFAVLALSVAPQPVAGVAALASVDADGQPTGGTGGWLSADGRYLAFRTSAGITVRDTATGEVDTVDVPGAFDPVLSGDGRHVVYRDSSALLLTDLDSGVTQRVDVEPAEGWGPGYDYVLQGIGHAVTPDGSAVYFSWGHQSATGPYSFDIYRYDAATGTTTNVTADHSDLVEFVPSLSADGSTLTYTAQPGSGGDYQVYVRSLTTGYTEVVSVTPEGLPANGSSDWSTLSAEGRYVGYDSDATDIVPGVDGTVSQVYVYDRVTGVSTLASTTEDGLPGDARSERAFLDGSGTRVVFWSASTTLAPGAAPGGRQVYLKDLATGELSVVSASPARISAMDAQYGMISQDGSSVVFHTSTGLVAEDTNAAEDVYLARLPR